MSSKSHGHPDNGNPATNNTQKSTASALPNARLERRSPTRPRFINGWQKRLWSKLAEARAAAPAAAEPIGRIDIWVANPTALLKARSCLRVLSASDRLSLDRIQDPEIRRSATAARILLRIGLSWASGHKIAPSKWRFDSPALSRPMIASDLPQINFSISHVNALSVVAVSASLDVGIDVECVDQNVGDDVIAEFSHLDEHSAIGGLPRPQEIREFIRLWTLKESYTKLLGRGHALDFKSIKFTLDPVNLKAAGKGQREFDSTQFENFYVSSRHALFHASLAIRHRAGSAGSAVVQIINLATSEGKEAATAVPLSG